jgi:SNF2 family DNA or RNA helicase
LENNTNTYQLVFAITKHDVLGVLIEAFAVELLSQGGFSMTYFKVGPQSIGNWFNNVTNEKLEIIKLVDEYSENSIVQKFSKKASRFNEFVLKELDNKKFENHIRPYIERRLARVISLLTTYDIPLYFKGNKTLPFHDEPARNVNEKVDVNFNFNFNQESIKYFISLKNQGENIKLYNKNALILTISPAWLFIDNSVYNLKDEINGKTLLPFFSKEFIEIQDKFIEKYFSTFIKKTITLTENFHTEGFEVEKLRIEPKPRLVVQKDWQDETTFKLEFQYQKVKFDVQNPDSANVKYVPNQKKFIKTFRDLEKENETLQFLEKLGLALDEGSLLKIKKDHSQQGFSDKSVFDLVNWLNRNERKLLDIGFDIKHGFDSDQFFTGKIEVKSEVQEKNDWFDLNINVYFDQFKIPFTKLRRHLLYGKREYKLPDGKIAVLPAEWFVKYKDLLVFSKEENEGLKVSKRHKKVLDSSFNMEEKSQQDYEKLSSEGEIAQIEIPENFHAELRPYQKIGFDWMYFLGQNGFGGCLADDMGLGKTVQTLALLQKTAEENKVDEQPKEAELGMQLSLFGNKDAGFRMPSLIVMPTSLIYNWTSEIQKFAPKLRYKVHSGMQRDTNNRFFKYYDIIISSYGIVRNDISLFKEIEFKYLILDESQFIKNPSSKIYKTIIQLKAEHKLVLTGTPIENSLNDLWAQMNFLNPGLLGDSSFFKKQFVESIEKSNDENQGKRLKNLIKPFILRRTKNEVAKDLPELTQNIRYCEMPKEHKSYYEKVKSSIRNEIFKSQEMFEMDKKMMHVLRGLTKLRQIANHPYLADHSYNGNSGKFDEVFQDMENIVSQNHKILIFSSFVSHLKIFEEELKKRKWKYEMLTGNIKSERFNDTVRTFGH